MKISDGLFHKLFDVIAKEYPDIVPEHWIVDIGAAKLADSPETFDVVVMPNLYGDILSDVAAQIAGSVGLAGSANIGDHIAMFEAIHGSAPRRAGQNLANPSGLLLGAVMMLVHIGQPEVAGRVHNAWLRTIEEGVHTYDIFAEGVSKEKVGTKEFAKAVIQRMGKEPEKLKVVEYKVMESKPRESTTFMQAKTKEIVGVDIFVDKVESNPNKLADVFNALNVTGLKLEIITNRGVKVWPEGQPETYLSNHWRCRFKATSSTGTSSYNEIVTLLQKAGEAGIDVTGTETLYNYDGVLGYSLGAGE
jgi:isocitrate dehydrogenase